MTLEIKNGEGAVLAGKPKETELSSFDDLIMLLNDAADELAQCEYSPERTRIVKAIRELGGLEDIKQMFIDARRYRKLRSFRWWDNEFAVIYKPRSSANWLPFGNQLDEELILKEMLSTNKQG